MDQNFAESRRDLIKFMERKRVEEKEERERIAKEEKEAKEERERIDRGKLAKENEDRIAREKSEKEAKEKKRVLELAAAIGSYDRSRDPRLSDLESTPVKRKKEVTPRAASKSATRKTPNPKSDLQTFFEEQEKKMKRAIAGVPDPVEVILSSLAGKFSMALCVSYLYVICLNAFVCCFRHEV